MNYYNSVLRPFQDYFSSYETGQSVGGRKREDPEKNHLAHPQASNELFLSCKTLNCMSLYLYCITGVKREPDFSLSGLA